MAFSISPCTSRLLLYIFLIFFLGALHSQKKTTSGTQRMEVGEEGESIPIYLSLQCHHQNDSSIKMGSEENHFNVSLIVRDSHETVSTNHNLFEQKGEPKSRRPSAYQPNALPLGQTGLHFVGVRVYLMSSCRPE